jgi:hypothetical protein
MSETVVEQSQDDGPFPKIRASWNQNRLVQQGKRRFEVCKADNLPVMDHDFGKASDFNSEAGKTCVDDHGFDGIKLDGFIKFERYILVFFHEKADKKKEIMWMLKSKLSSGWSSRCKKALDEFLAKDKNDMSRNRECDSDSASDTDIQSVNDKNRHKRNSKDASESENDEKIISSREGSRIVRSASPNAPSSRSRRRRSQERSKSPDSRSPSRERVRPTRSRNSNPRSSRDRHYESRERSESPDLRQPRSGETPERDLDGGKVVYGRENWGVTRAIINRGPAYDIERVDECPDNCLAPKKDEQSFSPGGDKALIEAQSKFAKLNTDIFEVVGCAAKWHGRPETWIYVIIKISDETLRDRLKTLRKDAGEKYRGPLICSLTAFKKAVRNDKEELKKLIKLLKKSLFYQDAKEHEWTIVQDKINGDKAEGKTPKKTNAMTAMEKRMDRMEKMFEKLLKRVD